MREILFRGKRIDNGKWVYGFLYESAKSSSYNAESYILEKERLSVNFKGDKGVTTYVEFIPVDLSTVGQYTGLTDKNGKKIFEGDIVKAYSSYFNGECYREHEVIKPIAYDCGGFFLGSQDDDSEGWLGDWCISCDDTQDFIEVIGNIHDNPELLEVRE